MDSASVEVTVRPAPPAYRGQADDAVIVPLLGKMPMGRTSLSKVGEIAPRGRRGTEARLLAADIRLSGRHGLTSHVWAEVAQHRMPAATLSRDPLTSPITPR